jgi:Ca-activated chloride channel family protein
MIEFRFAYPHVFLLLIPAALFLFQQWRGRWQSAPAVMRYSDTRLLSGLPVGLRVQLRRLPDALRFIAWLLLVAALARPQAGNAREVLRGAGIDMAVALDISASMGTQDFAPYSRLDAAKTMIDHFIARREFDSIGLIVFAEEAFYQAPPTLDYAILRRLLVQVQLAEASGNSGKTAVGVGIAAAANMLRPSQAASKAIILLTDGTNNTGSVDPLSAAQAASAFDIRIYTIGMGNPAAGEMDEATLQSVAAVSNGRYFNALQWVDLEAIFAEIDRLERSEVERQLNIRWQEQAHHWLILALIFLILERFLRVTLFQTIP